MNLKLVGKLGILLAAAVACLTLGSGIARADSVTYTFTGAGYLAGTDFTYISTTGYLPLSPATYVGLGTLVLSPSYSPTTATDLFVGGVDYGQITGFSFINEDPLHVFGISTASGPFTDIITCDVPCSASTLDPTQPGSQALIDDYSQQSIGTLTIAPTVPEIDSRNSIDSLALIVGALLIMRGRRKNATPIA